MSDLTRFRDHCNEMAKAEHKPECVERLAAWERRRATFVAWRRWDDVRDPGPRPDCDGCNTLADRVLFARLADEVDDYLDPHPTLEGIE